MDLYDEIKSEQQKENLSNEQVAILDDFIKQLTYKEIKTKHKLSCHNVIVRVVIRTIQLQYWGYEFEGGNDFYLCEKDTQRFYKYICDNSHDINCVTCSVAIQLAADLKRSRSKKAIRFLESIKRYNLIHHIKEVNPPCREFIYKFADQLDIRIVSAQTLEYGRRIYCDYEAITEYFIIYGELFKRDKRLILNMDETSLSSRKRLKVLAKKTQLPLITENPKIPHLTGVITVSASGHLFSPLIVLPNKKTLRYLKDFEDECYFVSTLSGWMTKKTFLYYTFLIISQISQYRLTLDEKIRDDPILLIMDGAKSHISFISAYLFSLFNIDLLLIPPHTSHLLSPFDVALASPLKTYFSELLNELNYSTSLTLRKNLTNIRTRIIEIFLSASTKACTLTNITSGFNTTGIYPLNPEIPLNSDYTMNVLNIFTNNAKKLPTLFLNSNKGLEYLFYEEYGRQLTQNDLNGCYTDAINLLTNNLKINSGIPLSKIPDILIDKGQSIEKLKIPVKSK